LGKVKIAGQQPTDATAGIITLAEIAAAGLPRRDHRRRHRLLRDLR
jgi:hypothetical protein